MNYSVHIGCLDSLGFRGRVGLGLLTLLLRSRRRLLLRLLVLGSGGSLVLVAIRGGPQSEVVTQELHDEGAVAVALLGEVVELSNRIIERLLGKVTSAIGRVQNLVVEDGEVKGETKADGVGGGKVSLSDIGSVLRWSASCAARSTNETYLVSLVGGGSSNLALVAGGKLSEIAVIIALPAKRLAM